MTTNGRKRVVIEGVTPEIDCGRYAAQRVAGEEVVVQADAFTDGHDQLSVALLYKQEGEEKWHETPMRHLGNDRWEGTFEVLTPGIYRYTIQGWVDNFSTWQKELGKKHKAGQDLETDFVIGSGMIADAAEGHSGEAAGKLRSVVEMLKVTGGDDEKVELCLSSDIARLVAVTADRSLATTYRELTVNVSRGRALFSTWYEMFPRSSSPEPGRHGTFRDCEILLPEIAEMGFDVIYFPPIHPIGRTNRKGKNNSPKSQPGDPGSPWAIGASEGGAQVGTSGARHNGRFR